MTRQQYDRLLAEFEGSPRYLKRWAYRTVASARNGQRINPEDLVVAKMVVKFIELEGL